MRTIDKKAAQAMSFNEYQAAKRQENKAEKEFRKARQAGRGKAWTFAD